METSACRLVGGMWRRAGATPLVDFWISDEKSSSEMVVKSNNQQFI